MPSYEMILVAICYGAAAWIWLAICIPRSFRLIIPPIVAAFCVASFWALQAFVNYIE